MEVNDEHKIIILEELLSSRKRKQSELDYYQEQLEVLQNKMNLIEREITLTNLIIGMIQEENVIDLKDYLEKRQLEYKE